MSAIKRNTGIRYKKALAGCLVATVFLGMMLLMTNRVHAEKLWNEDFYRAVDGSGELRFELKTRP